MTNISAQLPGGFRILHENRLRFCVTSEEAFSRTRITNSTAISDTHDKYDKSLCNLPEDPDIFAFDSIWTATTTSSASSRVTGLVFLVQHLLLRGGSTVKMIQEKEKKMSNLHLG